MEKLHSCTLFEETNARYLAAHPPAPCQQGLFPLRDYWYSLLVVDAYSSLYEFPFLFLPPHAFTTHGINHQTNPSTPPPDPRCLFFVPRFPFVRPVCLSRFGKSAFIHGGGGWFRSLIFAALFFCVCVLSRQQNKKQQQTYYGNGFENENENETMNKKKKKNGNGNGNDTEKRK